MKFIEKADLYFILPINKLIDFQQDVNENNFLKHLLSVQNDEFSDRLNNSTKRSLLIDEILTFNDLKFNVKLYGSNFDIYNSSLIYLHVNIDKKIEMKHFVNMINGNNILHKYTLNNYQSISSLLISEGIDKEEIEEVFLFCQLEKISPEFPREYDEGIKYIDEYKQQFHQLLLRSDTNHKHLRIDNHSMNFENISNFYGTIDLCSPIMLLQIYQHPITSVCYERLVYDLKHRACWWLTLTDVLFIQKSVLSDTLKLINNAQDKEKKKAAKTMSQIEKVLLNMQEYWYFEDFTHEITKKVVNKVKDRIGVVGLLESVLRRVESLENSVLREINEDQNEYNFFLNIILLIIAIVQIVPVVNDVVNSIGFSKGIDFNQVIKWVQSIAISISFPLLVYLIRKLNRKRFVDNNMLLRQKRS